MSLTIEKKTGEQAELILGGRLDTTTAPELEAALEDVLMEATALVMDLKGLEYISSAGLRVILKAQKEMDKREGLQLRQVPDSVMEVFDITGFSDFLDIEK
jgi:anti-sigma B factor antagonist